MGDDEQTPLAMTLGDLRALVGRVWRVDPRTVGITAGPRSIEAWAMAADRPAAQIFVSRTLQPGDEELDPARVVVEAAHTRLAENLDIQRGAVSTAARSLDEARHRLAETQQLLAEVSALLGGKDGAP